MPAPTVDVTQGGLGRRGWVHLHVVWTQTDSNDLEGAIVLDLDNYLHPSVVGRVPTGIHKQARYAVEYISVASALNVSGDIYFDSVPMSAAALVLAFPIDATSAERDFSDYPSGAFMDPNPQAPGNVLIDTRNSLPGDELFLTMRYKVKGWQPANGVLAVGVV